MICNNCNVQPVCKIFEQNEKIKNDIAISVDYCNFMVDKKSNSPTTEIKFVDLRKRMEDLKAYEDNLKRDKCEQHICESCGATDDYCQKCSVCGRYICPNCSVESIDGKTYCLECYNE